MNLVSRLAIRSMFRNGNSTVVKLAGLILSFSLLFSVLIMLSSMYDFILDTRKESSGNVDLTMQVLSKDMVDDLSLPDEIKSMSRVSLLGGIFSEKTNSPHEHIAYAGFLPDDKISFTLIAGHMPKKPGEAVISTTVNIVGEEVYRPGDIATFPLERMKDERRQVVLAPRGAHGETKLFSKEPVESRTVTIVGITANSPLDTYTGMPAVYEYMDETTIADSPYQQLRLQTGALSSGEFHDLIQTLNAEVPLASVVKNTDLTDMYPGSGSLFRISLFTMTAIILAIFGIAGVLLIQNTFFLSFSERTRELSLLSSVGMTSRQRFGLAMTEGFFLFSVAFPTGFLLAYVWNHFFGVAVTPLLQREFMSQAILRPVINIDLLVSTFVIGLAFVLLATFLPVMKSRRISPITAMRRQDDIKLTATAVRTSGWWKGKKIEADLARKNMKRNKKPFRATLVSITFSLVLFLLTLSIVGFAKQGATAAMVEPDWDATIYGSGEGSDASKIMDEIKPLIQQKGVEDAVVCYKLSATTTAVSSDLTRDAKALYGDRIDIDVCAFDEVTLSRLTTELEWEKTVAEGEAILFNQIADPASKKRTTKAGAIFEHVPDQIVLEQMYGERNAGEDSEWKEAKRQLGTVDIVHTVNRALPAWPDERASLSLLVSIDTMRALEPQEVQLEVHMKIDSAMRGDVLLDLQAAIKPLGNDFRLVENRGSSGQHLMLLSLVRITLSGFATIMGLIGLLNLYNSLMFSLMHRRKEFAMLRSVGMTKQHISAMIRLESLMYGFKVLCFGVPIAVLLTFVVFSFLNNPEITFDVPVLSYVLTAAFIFLLIHLIMKSGTMIARSGNIADTLKREVDY